MAGPSVKRDGCQGVKPDSVDPRVYDPVNSPPQETGLSATAGHAPGPSRPRPTLFNN